MDPNASIRFHIVMMAIILYWYLFMRKTRPTPKKYAPMLERDIYRNNFLSGLYNGEEKDCISELRMRKHVFFKLCDVLNSCSWLVPTRHCSVEEQVAMFLTTVGLKKPNRDIAFTFKRSPETVSHYFGKVLNAISQLGPEMLRHKSLSTHPKIMGNPHFDPYFKDCIGALDGTHIPATVPAHMVDRFRGRKSLPTQNVLAIVDFDLCFTYVLAGWEGSAHDATVLRDALERPTGLRVPEGKFYLADAGYAAKPGFLPPYRQTRYHLSEWGNRAPRNHRELFNKRHSSLRVAVERAFGTLKNRFKILKFTPYHPLSTQVKLVLACCILHNWILEEGVDELVYTEDQWIRSYPRSEARTARQQREENTEWVGFRDNIAQAMWAARNA